MRKTVHTPVSLKRLKPKVVVSSSKQKIYAICTNLTQFNSDRLSEINLKFLIYETRKGVFSSNRMSDSYIKHTSHSQMCIFISSMSITINIWQIA